MTTTDDTTSTTCPTHAWCVADHAEEAHRALLEHEYIEARLVSHGIPGLCAPGEHVPSGLREPFVPFHRRGLSVGVEVEALGDGPVAVRLDVDHELPPAEARDLARRLLAAADLLDPQS